MVNTTDKKLTTVEQTAEKLSEYLSPAAQKELRTMASEDLQHLDLRGSLPTIKIGHQTGVFEMPGGEVVKKFEAIVAFSRRFNIAWMPAAHPDYKEDEQTPWCVSEDCINGSRPQIHISEDPLYATDKVVVDYLFGKCAECYLNQFGSACNDNGDRGEGRQCKSQTRLFLFGQDQEFSIPSILIVPPTSLRHWSGYATYCVQTTNGLGTPAALTEFSLEKQSRGSQTYSQLRCRLITNIAKDNPQTFAQILNWRAAHKDVLIGRDVVEDVAATRPVQETETETEDDLPF